jgi:hypothetical protein
MLERVGSLSSPAVVLLATFAAIVLLSVLLVAELWTWKPSGIGNRVRELTVALASAHLAFWIAFGIGMNQLAIKYDDRFAFGLLRWFSATLLAPYVLLALTIWLGVALMRSRRDRAITRWRGWSAVTASGVLLLVIWSYHIY